MTTPPTTTPPTTTPPTTPRTTRTPRRRSGGWTTGWTTARTAKVPEITAVFWLVKVLTTGMGEAASDYLGETSLVLGGLVGVGSLVGALAWQLRAREYSAVRYWTAVSAVAVFGTMTADITHVVTGLSYAVTTAAWAVVVAVLFTAWWKVEGTLSIHAVDSTRRECSYWATVLATFALGTAAGDLTGLALGWGFLASGLLFGAAMLVPLAAWRLGLSPVVAFWSAYVLTRPFGASFADWLGKPAHVGGGVGLGDGLVTVVALAAIAALVGVLAVTRADVQRPAARAVAGREAA
ncbi:COG4705 family protein [Quadrisphaera setariae]|uniref:Membrane-anchored protein n=1 Tax=Quadrisphaera setariae TaxID=2593304 RepID=A0A5C8ZIK9_9ACTN|nr:hypothetical protein [Quadrisphaera setariae]TXR56979.1 hypothetical protein FMM08_05635 [Quadrisphaera setariae]